MGLQTQHTDFIDEENETDETEINTTDHGINFLKIIYIPKDKSQRYTLQVYTG